VVAEKLQRVHEIGIAADESFHEPNPGVEVALFGARHFISGTAFYRHTTAQSFRAAPPSQAEGGM
jgi:hypothetical protein